VQGGIRRLKTKNLWAGGVMSGDGGKMPKHSSERAIWDCRKGYENSRVKRIKGKGLKEVINKGKPHR